MVEKCFASCCVRNERISTVLHGNVDDKSYCYNSLLMVRRNSNAKLYIQVDFSKATWIYEESFLEIK